MVKVHVVDLKSETIASPISVRAYLNQTITEFKQLIAQVSVFMLFFTLLDFMDQCDKASSMFWYKECIISVAVFAS